MKNAALVAHIRQLCCLGLGGRAIMPALLNAVRELVPFDAAEFAWLDARGELGVHLRVDEKRSHQFAFERLRSMSAMS